MKWQYLLLIAIILTAFAPPLYKKVNKKPVTASDNKGFAVVELFTSEGCSSCPPADKLAARLQTDYSNRPVYVLAFHVDYWNNLGWKDVFSDASYSDRQRRYADWLHLESVYTPQMVINGSSEYLGSDDNAVVKAINKNLAQPATQSLTLKVNREGSKVVVEYQTADDKNAELVLALVQKQAQSNVRAGENAGKKLSHVQIVRQLVQQDISSKKNITLNLPNNFNANEYELIGFIQHKNTGRIVAAAKGTF